MWPEAVNNRAGCGGVRFNLATSAPAKFPTEEEVVAVEGADEHAAVLTRDRQMGEDNANKKKKHDGSPASSQCPSPSGCGSPELVFAHRRPPSLPAEVVAPLSEGMGGWNEGGWEAVAGAGI